MQRKEKKRKDYAFRRQFNEKPSIIPGCPEGACKLSSGCWLDAVHIQCQAQNHGTSFEN